jgi:hypothetical protein
MGNFMDIRQIRRENLRFIIESFPGSKTEFAEKYKFNESYFGQLMMNPSKTNARNIGHGTARKIEEAVGLAYGDLDTLMDGAMHIADADPELAEILSDLRQYLTHNSIKWDVDRINNFGTGLTKLWRKTGKKPDITQAVELVHYALVNE